MKTIRNITLLTLLLFLLGIGAGAVAAQEEEPPQAEGEELGQNPVALYLAEVLGVEYDDIIQLQREEGYGLGEISRAYYLLMLAEAGEIEGLGGDVSAILAQVKETGWGVFMKNLGLHPGGGHGLGWMFKEFGKKPNPGHGKPEWAGGPPVHTD